MIILVELNGGDSIMDDIDIRSIDTEKKVINDYDCVSARKQSKKVNILELEPETVIPFTSDVSIITKENLDEIGEINLRADDIKDSQHMTLSYYDEEKKEMVIFYTEKALNNLPENLVDVVDLIRTLVLNI